MAILKAYNGYYLWDYVPSRVAAIILAAVFLIGTLLLIWRSLTTRSKFGIPFIVGGLCKYLLFPL